MEKLELTETQEDYLKQILLIEEASGHVSTTALAERMGVRPPSATEMVRRLAQLGLVEHARYRGMRLSELGRRVALEMVRHHRLLETFLVERLGYSWDQVHDEAERLEHVISERFEARIAEVLGHPSHDPHGAPIPDIRLIMPPAGRRYRLAELSAGCTGTVARIAPCRSEQRDALARVGVEVGSELEVVASGDREVGVRQGSDTVELPLGLARLIWIEQRSC